LDQLEKVKTAEVGNIFNFGREKAKEVGLFFKDDIGDKIPVWMGSYGIGVTRAMGVSWWKNSPMTKGIVWPACIAPYNVHSSWI
jgi:prolyl-tRNA synthetase